MEKQILARGDRGINKLNSACKDHDIAYDKYKDSERRSAADRILAERAWERVRSSDSSLGEKAAAWLVTNVMKAKSKLGSGCDSRKGQRQRKSKKPRRKQPNNRKIKRQSINKKKGEKLQRMAEMVEDVENIKFKKDRTETAACGPDCGVCNKVRNHEYSFIKLFESIGRKECGEELYNRLMAELKGVEELQVQIV